MIIDVSEKAIGSVLKQHNEIIAFYSYKFLNAEARYTSMEKEILGILKSLDHFRSILIPEKVIIYTENQNSIYEKDLTRRCQRWKYLMEEFYYELRKIEGKRNVIADSLSRLNLLRETERKSYWSDDLLKIIQKNYNPIKNSKIKIPNAQS